MTDIKFNFVIDCTDSALSGYINLNDKEAHKIFVRGDLNWCLQTFHILKRRTNLPVICSNRLLDDCVNIIHSDTLLLLKGNPKKFIVCARADFPKRRWAHYHIVQNKNQVSANTSFIPHWVQPGLIKRNPKRSGVKKVAYAGQILNGNLAGTVDAWKRLFEPYGIEFTTLTEGEWHNLNDIDVLMGIRSFDSNPYYTKPATKLFSAWHAHIPFIGGLDSGFFQVGTPNEDYLIASTPTEAVNAVLKLRDMPDLYNKIVSNGIKKAALYSEETIANAWVDVLCNPVIQRYKKWQLGSIYEQVRYKLLLNLSVRHQKSKQVFKKIYKPKNPQNFIPYWLLTKVDKL